MGQERSNLPSYEEQRAFVARLYAELPGVELLLRCRYGRRLGEIGVGFVLDETIRRALDFCHRFEAGRSLGAWLRGIAVNCACDELRRRGGAVDPAVIEGLAQAEPASEETHEALEALGLALARLSADERTVLLSDEPAADLGARLGRTRGSTYNLRWAAFKRLRTQVRAILGEWRDG